MHFAASSVEMPSKKSLFCLVLYVAMEVISHVATFILGMGLKSKFVSYMDIMLH